MSSLAHASSRTKEPFVRAPGSKSLVSRRLALLLLTAAPGAWLLGVGQEARKARTTYWQFHPIQMDRPSVP